MTLAPQITTPPLLLTYEEYAAEGEINGRYEISNGVRTFMPGPSEQHQDIVFAIGTLLKQYERASGNGKMILAPRDILISRSPLKTRQPDVMFISYSRHAQNPPQNNAAPMNVAPELVVEVLSPSDTDLVLEEKLRDYGRIGVQECWVVSADNQTVEVKRLLPDSHTTVAVYSRTQIVQSFVFLGLQVAVADIFTL